MSAYLDPKNDTAFKEIFANDKPLCISLLNAFLPVEETGMRAVTSIEYLPFELSVPVVGGLRPIVDVRCTDALGRQFIVEMQLRWEVEFDHRILYNLARAYSSQNYTGREFSQLQPVYSINFVSGGLKLKLPPDVPDDKVYYRYLFTEAELRDAHISGMEAIFIDLKKYARAADRSALRNLTKLRRLWLTFLTDVNERTYDPPPELVANPETAAALRHLEDIARSPGKRRAYDAASDGERRDITNLNAAKREGLAEGRAKGLAEGAAAAKLETARKMKADGLPPDAVARYTGLSPEQLQDL
jgi:predicted transposase/invertase (TIGR01784 family)